MNEGQGNEPSPLVHNGVLYLVNIQNIVQALDARTGELIWENHVGPNALIGQAAMRNMAIYQDKVFVATTDARLVALDARTGAKIWDTTIADRAKGYANTAGPMVMKGVVVNGLVGCDRYGNDGCWISGYDAATGKQLWKFNTVRRGTEQGAETWGKLADNLRIGGETWIAGSYDPDLDLTYWGVAQAKPWMRASRGIVELRQRALHELHRRAAAEGRHARVALSARARRIARPRRSVRARPRRHRRSEGGVHDRQARHPVEARSPQRRSSSATRKRSSRTCSSRSIRRPARRPIAATSSSSRPASGSIRARAPKAATTGRR